MSGKQNKRPANVTKDTDHVTVVSENGQHTPLLVPKKERDLGRPAAAIPRDPRQRTTNIDTSTDIALPATAGIVIKQEPALQSEIEIKEEKQDDAKPPADWKEQWLQDNQPSSDQQITVNSGQPSIKQEPVEEEPEPPMEDQCSVDSSSTVGLPSPNRMESFSAPPSPVAPTEPPPKSAAAPAKATSKKYSAPLDLEEEYEEMERQEQQLREALNSADSGYTQEEESGLDDTIGSELNDSMDQSEALDATVIEPAPTVKRSTFQIIKNPEVFKNVPPSSANDAMDVDEANQSKSTKIPVKVTKQNRSSMLVEDYLKSTEAPVRSKRPAPTPAAPKVTKRPKPNDAGVNIEVDAQISEVSPAAGPSRDPRLRNKNIPEPEPTIIEDPLSSTIKECILSRILKWSFKWIPQQLLQSEPPPILQKLKDPPLPELNVMHTLGAYSSFQTYADVYHPLLLHEIWSTVVNQYQKNKRPIWSGTFQHIDNVKRRPDEIRRVKFSTMLEETDEKKNQLVLMQEGDLVSCRFVRRDSAEEVDCLGYVTSAQITYGMRNKKVVNHHLTNVNKDILIEAIIAFRYSYARINLTGIYQIMKVASLKPLITLFDYESALNKSKLCRTVLNPNVDAFKLMFGGPRYKAEFLDQAQVDAVMTIAQTMMMSRPDEPKVALLEGAPGTGKTHLLVFIMQHMLAIKETQPRILYCAPTDSAVDELTRRLLTLNNNLPENSRFKVVRLGGRNTHPTVLNYTVKGYIERKGLASQVKSELTDQVDQLTLKMDELQKQMISIKNDIDKSEEAMNDEVTGFLRKKLEDIENEIVLTSETLEDAKRREEKNLKEVFEDLKMDVINSADVVCTSMDPVSNPELDDYLKSLKRRRETKDRPFLCCIMDDATMCSEPHSLLPLAFGVNKLLLVGDADPVYNTLNSEIAKQNGLGNSLFSRFQEFVNKHASSDVRLKIKLEVQYRMAWPIWLWPSKFYYGNNVIVPEGREFDTPLHPFIVLDVRDGQEVIDDAHLVNEAEARLIAALVIEAFHLNRHSGKLMSKSVAVVTFSPKQKDLIKREIANKYKDMESRSIKMEKQQLEVALAQDLLGKEKDIVIVSCVKSELPKKMKKSDEFKASKLEFITDYWNTALTRARETLVVVGKLRALLHDETLRDFVRDAERRQVIREVASRYHPSIVFDCLEKPEEI